MEIKLYKRNANDEISVWSINNNNTNNVYLSYGTLGGKLYTEKLLYNRDLDKEIESRVKEKRKVGYKSIEDVYDNAPIELTNTGDILHYLKTYLPKYNTTSDGFVLPMLAKTLEDNKPFEKYGAMLGQWKINGLRCIVGAEKTVNDLFTPVRLTYTSREGIRWNMSYLDDIIINSIGQYILNMMVEEKVCLDGELYLPGYTVNDINSFVKNDRIPQHYRLQFWCYDLCIENMSATRRESLLEANCAPINIFDKKEHLNVGSKFNILPNFIINDIGKAIEYRDKFINLGFEGLIVRVPISEYAFGKRTVKAMYKFKRKEDGWFNIVDIIPEGKRINLPKFVCRNDINSNLFECTINEPQAIQEKYLVNKENYIGKQMLVEYRERSGVQEVPFHAKGIKIR